MFQQVQVLSWVLEIDKEATLAAHEKLPKVWPASCTCLSCRNFATAIDFLPQELVQLCSILGVDKMKAAEVWDVDLENEDGTRFYAGWYHTVGRILSTTDPYQSSTHGTQGTQFCGSFQVGFTEKAILVPEYFPRPVLQLDFYGDFPWVMDDKIGNIPHAYNP